MPKLEKCSRDLNRSTCRRLFHKASFIELVLKRTQKIWKLLNAKILKNRNNFKNKKLMQCLLSAKVYHPGQNSALFRWKLHLAGI